MSKDKITLTNGLVLKFGQTYNGQRYVAELELIDKGHIIARTESKGDWFDPVDWAHRALAQLENDNQKQQQSIKHKLESAIDSYYREKRRLDTEAQHLDELIKEVREVEDPAPAEETNQA